jgi:large subunit ribosomal protein L13
VKATGFQNVTEADRKWYVVDGENQVLGRVASQVAFILKGKHKPTFSPHIQCGDHVIVVNAEKIRVTGHKAGQKRYTRYTGYPGGLRVTEYAKVQRLAPERVFLHAVRGMLPKNHLGRQMLNMLRIYRGTDHPHTAQKPEALPKTMRKA